MWCQTRNGAERRCSYWSRLLLSTPPAPTEGNVQGVGYLAVIGTLSHATDGSLLLAMSMTIPRKAVDPKLLNRCWHMFSLSLSRHNLHCWEEFHLETIWPQIAWKKFCSEIFSFESVWLWKIVRWYVVQVIQKVKKLQKLEAAQRDTENCQAFSTFQRTIDSKTAAVVEATPTERYGR